MKSFLIALLKKAIAGALVHENLIRNFKKLIYIYIWDSPRCLKNSRIYFKTPFCPKGPFVLQKIALRNFKTPHPQRHPSPGLLHSGFSLMELMLALVALSVALAAFAPMLSKKLSPTAKSAASTTLIKTDECKTLINQYCNLCNVEAKECLSCELSETTPPVGKTLNFEKCQFE